LSSKRFRRPLHSVLAFAFVLGAVPLVAAQTTAPLSLSVLVDQVQALFPKVEGEVIEAQGKRLTLTLGKRDGIQPGLDLSLYREGRELRHPRTGQLLGRTEETLGRVSVVEVFEAYSTASVTQGGGARPGDRVRVSAGKVPVTLLPFASGVRASLVEAVVYELVERLNRTGRFQVTMGDQVAVWLAREGIQGEEILKENRLHRAAEQFKIQHLLTLSFSQFQRKPYMEVRLFSFPRVEPLLSTAFLVPPSIKPSGQGQFSASRDRDSRKPKETRSLLARLLGGELETGTYSSGEGSIPLKEIAKFGFPVLVMDVAVSPKDQIPRLMLSDGARIFQYRLVNQALEIEWTYNAPGFGTLLSAQLADLDGDGVFEVVVNRHHAQTGMTSYVLSAKDGTPRLLADNLSVILLAVDENGDGVKETLWGQRYHPQQFFTPGQAERYTVRNGALVSGGPVAVPQSFLATGAALVSIAGKGTRALAFIDEHQRLRIAMGGEETWRSSTVVGNAGKGAVAEIQIQFGPTTRSLFFKMEPFPLAVDLDGDGIEELVIPQNQTDGMLAVVFRGPAGYRLQSINSGFEGIITGFGAIPGQDPPTLVASVVHFKGLLRNVGETQIIMTVPE
jgi:hypothetical protein